MISIVAGILGIASLACTEGRGLGHGRRAVCRPALWGVYQSQHGIQSHDTWSMWLMGNFSLSGEKTWSVRSEPSKIVLSHELVHYWYRNHECKKAASLTMVIAIADVMTGLHD